MLLDNNRERGTFLVFLLKWYRYYSTHTGTGINIGDRTMMNWKTNYILWFLLGDCFRPIWLIPVWLKVTKGYTVQIWGWRVEGRRCNTFFKNFDAIIDKSIVFIYVRKMKGHLDLLSLRGEKFHISAARQMSTCDMYRDFSPEIFPHPIFSFWEGNIERIDSAFFITNICFAYFIDRLAILSNWVMWGYMSPPCTFVCIHASQPVMPGWVEGGVTWKHRQF